MSRRLSITCSREETPLVNGLLHAEIRLIYPKLNMYTLKLYHRRRLILYKGISHTSSGGDAIDSASDVREIVGEHVLVEVRPMMSQVDVYACLRNRVVTPLTNVCS